MNNMEMASGKHLITLEHRWLEFFWFITLELLLQIQVLMEEAHDDDRDGLTFFMH